MRLVSGCCCCCWLIVIRNNCDSVSSPMVNTWGQDDVGAHTELALLLKKTLDGVLTLHTSGDIAFSSDPGCRNFIWIHDKVHGLYHWSECRGPYGARPTP